MPSRLNRAPSTGYPSDMTPPLTGRRILVPPSRLGPNPLIPMLERQGATVIAFPKLETQATDTAPLDAALEAASSFDWLVVAGERSAAQLLERLRGASRDTAQLPPRIAAIGHGAYSTLRKAGLTPAVTPREHFASGVANALGDVQGLSVLLLREAGASRALPDLLGSRGARVTALAGHAIRPRPTLAEARAAFGHPLDALALANPATVRLLVLALAALGLSPDRCLGATPIVAVGQATAEAASRLGLPADLVAEGRLKRLGELLIAWLGVSAPS